MWLLPTRTKHTIKSDKKIGLITSACLWEGTSQGQGAQNECKLLLASGWPSPRTSGPSLFSGVQCPDHPSSISEVRTYSSVRRRSGGAGCWRNWGADLGAAVGPPTSSSWPPVLGWGRVGTWNNLLTLWAPPVTWPALSPPSQGGLVLESQCLNVIISFLTQVRHPRSDLLPATRPLSRNSWSDRLYKVV